MVEVVSNSTIRIATEVLKAPKKLIKRGKNIDYNFLMKCDNKSDALKIIEEEKFWIKGNKKENKSDGFKQNYVCHYHVHI